MAGPGEMIFMPWKDTPTRRASPAEAEWSAGAGPPGGCLWLALMALGGCAATVAAPPPAEVSLVLGRGVRMKLKYVSPGSFVAGSPSSEVGRRMDETPRRVTISRGFYLGVTETTQEQWREVMGSNPSYLMGDRRPVEHVSWRDATAFCRALSAKTGLSCRLPTEVEWEYACRAGAAGAFCFGDDEAALGEYAWYQGNSSERKTHPVGGKRPNAWGFHDMHGSVREWCADRYRRDPRKPTVDAGEPLSDNRVLRGGSWGRVAGLCRSAKRDAAAADSRKEYAGLRVVVETRGGVRSAVMVSD